jgi:receptor-binding and translocation channel-forming TcA subunit of Tc toxin/ABC toxin-like protein/putative peptidoglycan binding protein
MKLQGRDLKSRMIGPDVALLHSELQRLEFNISPTEIQRKFFGSDTGAAVREFQERHSLAVNGVVNKVTARLINADVDALPPQKFVLRGQVRSDDGTLLPEVMVRAFDKDLRALQLLGEVFTNAEGRYEITYTADQFTRAEKSSADLLVRVVSESGVVLAESDVTFNASTTETIDLVVPELPQELDLSEFEQLVAVLRPLLDGARLFELSEEDAAFLAGETGEELKRIIFLGQSARLARETGLATEVFYGLARGGLELKLEALLAVSTAKLREVLKLSVTNNIVPDSVGQSLDEILARFAQLRLEQGVEEAYQFFGEVRDKETGGPLSGLTVCGTDLDAEPEAAELGCEISNAQGRFALTYTAPHIPAPEDGTAPVVLKRRLRLTISDAQGTPLHEKTVTTSVGSRKLIEILVPVPEVPDTSANLEEHRDRLNLSRELVDRLRNNGIERLGDIRARNGLAGVPGFEPTDRVVRRLEAHARLSSISDNIDFNNTLIDEDLTSVEAIAEVTRADLVRNFHEAAGGDLAAAGFHAGAVATNLVLNNLTAGLAADVANGLDSPLAAAVPAAALKFSKACHCEGFESAISPLAYLADLLNYATKHLKVDVNGQPQLLTVARLETDLHQLFGQFPVRRDIVETQVAQVRLCIEALRHQGPNLGADIQALARAEKDYRFAAYRALLGGIGTTFDELRRARADDTTRTQLATRLGLAPDRLADLLLDPTTLTELDLERLFGLPDTTRDALSRGAKLGDLLPPDSQITRWYLEGAQWNRNTDRKGMVYLRLSSPAADRFLVEVFSDLQRTQQIAEGERDSAEGSVALRPVEGSGLWGTVDINFSSAPEAIALSLIPEVLSAQFAELRAAWNAQDHPVPEVDPDRYPIIDPHFVFPSDLRSSFEDDPAFQRWQARLEQVTAMQEEIKAERETPGGLSAAIELALGPDANGNVVTLQTLKNLRDTLNEGRDISQEIRDLHLEMASFSRLLALADLQESLPVGETLLESELLELDQILTQGRKVREFVTWRAEEQTDGLTLSPDHFRLAADEPETLPEWVASGSERRAWRRRLQARVDEEKTLIESFYTAVREAEAATLSDLRDALVLATDAPKISSNTKVDQVTRNFLIDAKAGACQRTTRVGQAIETLQALFAAARTGVPPDTMSGLEIDADHYEEEWQWLGSYERWRSAMLVFLYPENILLPSLRNEQTPGFIELVKDVRKHNRLTPEYACAAAQRYAEYFKDVCSLQVETSCTAVALLYRNQPCRGRVPSRYKSLNYFFGRSNETGKVYWSTIDPRQNCGREQSYWARVPGLENATALIGAVPYTVNQEKRYICLFACVAEGGEEKLLLLRYDLEAAAWEEEPIELELPRRNGQTPSTFTAVALQRPGDSSRPHLTIHVWNTIYDRKLNREATAWDDEGTRDTGEFDGDWHLLSPPSVAEELQSIWAMVQLDAKNFYVFALDRVTRIRYRIFGSGDDGYWHPLVYWAGEPIGAFSLGVDGKEVYAFWKETRGPVVRFFNVDGRASIPVSQNEQSFYRAVIPGNLNLKSISKLDTFDLWLREVAGLSLNQIKVTDDELSRGFLNFLKDEPPESEFDTSGSDINANEIFVHNKTRIELAGEFGERVRDGKHGINWRWADAMVAQLTAGQEEGLGSTLVKLVEDHTKVKKRIIVFKERRGLDTLTVPSPAATGLEQIGAAFGALRGSIMVSMQFVDQGAFRGGFNNTTGDPTKLNQSDRLPLTPRCSGPFEITEQLSDSAKAVRRQRIANVFSANQDGPDSHQTYLEEAYYFVPVFLALQLRRRAQFSSALNWFSTVYDYSLPEPERKLYHGLIEEERLSENLKRATNWLRDPLNPHAIAATRANSYSRFTLLAIIQCLLEFADAEFTMDSAESVGRARGLYSLALDLLNSDVLGKQGNPCEALVEELDTDLGPIIASEAVEWQPLWEEAIATLARSGNLQVLDQVIANIQTVFLNVNVPLLSRLTTMLEIVAEAAVPGLPAITLATIEDQRREVANEVHSMLFANADIFDRARHPRKCFADGVRRTISAVFGVSENELDTADLPVLREPLRVGHAREVAAPAIGFSIPSRFERNPLATATLVEAFTAEPLPAINLAMEFASGYLPLVNPEFCVQPNPIPAALRLQAEVNLFKIRTCRNIAGDERQLELLATPTDLASIVPSIGSNGTLVLPGPRNLRPTQFRYSVLIERAKQLVGFAQQIEAAFLSALEKRDAEFFQLIRARQELRLSRAGVRLNELRTREAEHAINIALLQREMAEIQEDHFDALIDEKGALGVQVASLVTDFFASSGAGIFKAAAGFVDLANQQREWKLKRTLAEKEIEIGKIQIRAARDHLGVVGQERNIGEMQADHAEATAEFLTNKFTNAELFEWMSEVLEGVYSFFLKQATATARLAEVQLAFERQELAPAIIQADYWEAPLGIEVGPSDSAPDRRGLTGSARLLRDVSQLDQIAFETNKRKLQLTKTISLAQTAPVEFQRFRETGLMRFDTTLDLFDRDFPGHYLRLINRVRTSVIALIPPTLGINATLATSGLSQVVLEENGVFQATPLIRSTESTALTSPREATGLFELTPQSPELLRPFEYMGVATNWELRLPKPSNPFNFDTIADVLLTIEYTALDSLDYRRQVISELDDTLSADRPFSFRQEFADAWYDLHNPEPNTPLTVRFKTRPSDFRPNLGDFEIQELVLFFSRADGAPETFELNDVRLDFDENENGNLVGGAANSIDSIISTRRGNASEWKVLTFSGGPGRTPFGTWTLTLPETLSDGRPTKLAFENEEFADILFVITYAGSTSAWPE